MNKTVITKDGVQGRIIATQDSEEDRSQVVVQFDDRPPVLIPAEMLVTQENGYHLPVHLSTLEQKLAQQDAKTGEAIVVPVIEEELHVEKETRESGRVRIEKVVYEEQETVDVPLFEEVVEVERVLVNRRVDHLVSARREENKIIVPVHQEVLVVQKQLFLKEEVHILTKQVETHQPKQATLHREEVHVERVGAQDEQPGVSTGTREEPS